MQKSMPQKYGKSMQNCSKDGAKIDPETPIFIFVSWKSDFGSIFGAILHRLSILLGHRLLHWFLVAFLIDSGSQNGSQER
jgi:hypothetical protein